MDSPQNIPAISAVVRTFNSSQTLERTLEGIKKQNVGPVEIVVVDSGSTDKTLDVAARYGARIVNYPANQEFNYSKALNIGIAAASGELILILSSHSVMSRPDTLRRMYEALVWTNASAAYCSHLEGPELKTVPPAPGARLISVEYADTFLGNNGMWNTCSLLRKALWETHLFDETMPASEDQEWAAWHFNHSRLPTVCLRNEGVLYLNPYQNDWKLVRDELVRSERLFPQLRRWPVIFGHARKAFTAGILCDWRKLKFESWLFFAKASRRFYSPRLVSTYSKGSSAGASPCKKVSGSEAGELRARLRQP